MSIENAARSVFEELREGRSDEGATFSERLTTFVLGLLEYEEHTDEPIPCHFEQRDAWSNEVLCKLDGYDLHPSEEDHFAVDLYVTLDFPEETLHTVTPAEANAVFRQLRAFVEQVFLQKLHEEPGIDAEVVDLGRTLVSLKELTVLRLVLVTNGLLREYDRNTNDKIAGLQVQRRAIDLRVIERLWHPDKLQVDFAVGEARGLRCVPLPSTDGGYRSYLAVVQGQFLADLYAKHAQRLLDANVRSYLRATGKVNKEILATLRDHPEMFFAYNNGITATAEDVTVENTSDGPLLLHCSNLQIVNGGQTTASLYQALQKKISLDKVFVPMKISEVRNRERYDEIVQQISITANSQNKVNFSDLGANQPFHVNLARIAQQERAPVKRNAAKEPSWWFYERMRGQYENERNRLTGKQKKEWDELHPKSQLLTKTEVAKFVLAWEQFPHVVSAGGEKTYKHFSKWLRERGWLEAGSKAPDTAWFQQLIAKALLYEHIYRRVEEAKIGGHRPNVTAYVLAWLAFHLGAKINLQTIWQTQSIDEALADWITAAIPVVHQHLLKTPRPDDNVGEWTKKEACWTALRERPFENPRSSR